MKCKYCGAELLGKSVYCIQCGRKNDDENVVATAPAKSAELVGNVDVEKKEPQEPEKGSDSNESENMQTAPDELVKAAMDNVAINTTKGKHVSGKKVLLTVASILGVFAVAVMAVLFIRPVNNCFQMVRGSILMNIDEYQAVDAYWTALENGHLSAANKLISHYVEDGEYGMASNVVSWLYGNYREKADSVLVKFAPEKPDVSMEPGTYNDCVDVAFTSDEDDVEIYVSENGGEFILSDGASYHLNQKETYTYQVYLTNRLGIDSDTYSFEYVMDIPAPADVEVSLTPGTFTDYQMIEMTSPDGSDIYYTLDGTKPTQESALYQEPIRIGNGTSKLVASAIDSKGTWGNCFEGTYEIVLPIPENVAFSVPGGTYPEIFQLTLEQTEGARIYYTTNGTEPSANSTLYEGPIDIHAGYQTIKAVAINDYDMPSETVAQDYTVTYNKYGRYPKNAMIGGDCFAVLGANRSLTRLDENLTVSETYDINDVLSIYADDQSLFYMASNTLYIADPKNMDQSKKLVDMEVETFALAHDCIYFCSLGTLYRVDKNGENILTLKKSSGCRISGCWNNTLYFYDANQAYAIAEKDGVMKNIDLPESERFFVNSFNCYYIRCGSLYYTNLDNGATTTIMGELTTSHSLDDAYELINVKDETQWKHQYCDEIFVCHNTLYVRVGTENWVTVYHRINQVTDRSDTSYSYQWYAVDMATNTVTQTSVDTISMCVFDEAILSENGEKFTVVQ